MNNKKLNIILNTGIVLGFIAFTILAAMQNNKIIDQNTKIVAQQTELTRLQTKYKNLYKLREEERKEAKEKEDQLAQPAVYVTQDKMIYLSKFLNQEVFCVTAGALPKQTHQQAEDIFLSLVMVGKDGKEYAYTKQDINRIEESNNKLLDDLTSKTTTQEFLVFSQDCEIQHQRFMVILNNLPVLTKQQIQDSYIK